MPQGQAVCPESAPNLQQEPGPENLFQVFQTKVYEDGESYLIADMSISPTLHPAYYGTMVSYAVLFIILYPLGTIWLFFSVLWSAKSMFWNTPDLICYLFPRFCDKYHKHDDSNNPYRVQDDPTDKLASLDFLLGAYKSKYWCAACIRTLYR